MITIDLLAIEHVIDKAPKTVARRLIELHGDKTISRIVELVPHGQVKDKLLTIVEQVLKQDSVNKWNKGGII